MLGAVPTVGGVSVACLRWLAHVMATCVRPDGPLQQLPRLCGQPHRWRCAVPARNDNIAADGTKVAYAGGTTAAWFTLATASVHQGQHQRPHPTGAGALTVAMDGACLKCHKSADGGVGVDF